MMDLSILIVAYNVKPLVERCLLAISHSKDHLNKEIIFVDNGSNDGTLEMIQQQFPTVQLIRSPTNLGFIKANNIAYQYASGKYLLMLNSDAFVEEYTLQTLVDFMENRADCGALGCQAIDANGRLLPSIRFFPTPWRLFLAESGLGKKLPFFTAINDRTKDPGQLQECDWVTGCCLLTRKKIIDSFPFFLCPAFFMYNDDNDLCLRIKRAGWKVYCHPTIITHLSGANNNKLSEEIKDSIRVERLMMESNCIYYRRNYGLITLICYVLLQSCFYFSSMIHLIFRRKKEKFLWRKKQLKTLWKAMKTTSLGLADMNKIQMH